MSTDQHTKGRVVIKPGPRSLVNCPTEMIIQHESRQFDICYMAMDDHGNMEGNAQLIREAFNVTHETGKTPKELAALNSIIETSNKIREQKIETLSERVKELEAVLNGILELPQTIGHAYQMQDLAKKALNK